MHLCVSKNRKIYIPEANLGGYPNQSSKSMLKLNKTFHESRGMTVSTSDYFINDNKVKVNKNV